jgi:hypothetical protein
MDSMDGRCIRVEVGVRGRILFWFSPNLTARGESTPYPRTRKDDRNEQSYLSHPKMYMGPSIDGLNVILASRVNLWMDCNCTILRCGRGDQYFISMMSDA